MKSIEGLNGIVPAVIAVLALFALFPLRADVQSEFLRRYRGVLSRPSIAVITLHPPLSQETIERSGRVRPRETDRIVAQTCAHDVNPA